MIRMSERLIIIIIIIIMFITVTGLSPGGSGYFTCIQNMKLVITKFKSGGLHEKHVVATWNLGNHLSICVQTQGNQESDLRLDESGFESQKTSQNNG